MQRIDIVVAVYNGEGVIRTCVQALLKTAYPDFGIIVVNDGSTDGTERVLGEFAHRITVFNKPHGGVAQARNFGIAHSNADFIAITDADCKVHPLWLTVAMRHLREPQVGAVTGWLHYEVTNTLSAVREAEYALRFQRRKPAAHSVSCPVALFRKSALVDAHGFDTRFIVGGEDTDIGYRITEKGYNIAYEKEMLCYHLPEDSLMLYLKRNYRNALNHLIVLKYRKKRIFFSDDFFPLLLRLQPVVAFLFFVSVGCFVRTHELLWVSFFLFSAVLMLIDFLPVAFYVGSRKGIVSLPYTLAILTLRNIVWMIALFVGIIHLV